jgi:DNA-binding response OmpR family regulator
MDILVAEDNRDVFMDIKRILERSISGAKVNIWPGDGGMETAKLVILDLEHHASDSILSAVKIRRGIPVILIAAHNGNPARLISALDAGADDYLYKPLDKIELQERVKATLWEARQ